MNVRHAMGVSHKSFLSSCDEISHRVSNAPLITFTGCLVTLNRGLKRALICKIDKDGVNCKIVNFFLSKKCFGKQIDNRFACLRKVFTTF